MARIENFRRIYKKLKPLKLTALALYIMLPLFEKPGWCLTSSEIARNTPEGYWYCQNQPETISNSNIPKLPAQATDITYIICLSILFAFVKSRDYYRRRDKSDTVTLQLVLIALALANCVVSLVVSSIPRAPDGPLDLNSTWVKVLISPYLCTAVRPILGTLLIRSIKSFWRRYLTVMYGSLPMVIFIIIYVFYFSWMGNRLFSGTIEGVETFDTLWDSFFYMFVLLTTSNYPDVMLPAYSQERRFCIFFIVYLMAGLFLFMNLLLAIFYSNY